MEAVGPTAPFSSASSEFVLITNGSGHLDTDNASSEYLQSSRGGADLENVTEGCGSVPDYVTTGQILADLGPSLITLWVLATLVVLLMYGVLVRTSVMVYKRTPVPWRAHTIWISSVYPFMCLTSLGSLIVPASDSLLNAAGMVYMSIAASKFVDLCVLYFGGEAELLTSVGDAAIPLASPSMCCFCGPCCPRPSLGKRSLRVMTSMVHQLPYYQSGYFLFTLYLYWAGVTIVEEVSADSLSMILMLLNGISFTLALYGLAMLEGATRKHMSHFNYRAKFALMNFTLVLIETQKFIFHMAINFGGVPCTGSMSPRIYGAFIQNIVIIVEMFALGLMTHWVYLSAEKNTEDVLQDQEGIGEKRNADQRSAGRLPQNISLRPRD